LEIIDETEIDANVKKGSERRKAKKREKRKLDIERGNTTTDSGTVMLNTIESSVGFSQPAWRKGKKKEKEPEEPTGVDITYTNEDAIMGRPEKPKPIPDLETVQN